MNYAILSDVHANETALRAVLTDAQDFGADRVFCLGDVLGYGPDPVSALELVHDRAHVCLLGNHDAAVCGAMPVDDFTPVAAAAVATHTSRLSSKAMAWLRTLPSVCEGPGFACAHGDFSDPDAFNYILDPEDAMPSWEARDEPLLFVGHTHQPGIYVLGASGEPHRLEPMDFVVEDGKRYIVNVGSVGYPRSGACRSFYCIYDDSTRTVYFRSLPFDLEGYRRKMNGQGLVSEIIEYEPDGKPFKTVKIEYDNYGDEVNRCVYKAGNQMIEYTYTEYAQDGRVRKVIYEDKLHHIKEFHYFFDYDSNKNWQTEVCAVDGQILYIKQRKFTYYE